ncbi:hypothetical protein [Natrinema sp. 1APR25-10V2]|uniref:hypothetical protein n=1 Tax=Natrinema sp. 1APR25-10V2 TaxID=2951081 RepID=UPI0028764358|nr:hypothetical protein [Natrinema sp. 1APR25-10V2]MDS0476831.1 hypothetical protein [Natrinema sp. 1APR25-10V2]
MEPVNPDPELQEALSPRSKKFLERLYTVFSGESIDVKRETLIEIIADRHEDQLRAFLDDYEKLSDRNVNRRYGEEYLHESLGIDREKLDVKNRYELLLVLYEEDRADKLDSLIIRSELFAVKNEQEFQLDEELDLANIEERVRRFLRHTNQEEQKLDPMAITVDADGDSAALDIHQEYGRKYAKTFAFRKTASQDCPVNPDITGRQYYPLRNITIGIDQTDDGTTITFSKATDKWEETIEDLFSHVFDVDDLFERLEETKAPGVEQIQQGAKQAAEEDEADTADSVRELVETRKESAIEQVHEQDDPDEITEDLEQRLESVQLVGYTVSDDQSTGTHEFTIIADNLDELFETVEGIELSFEEYLEKAEEDNIRLVLRIQNELVKLDSADWKPLRGNRIAAENKKAIETLLGDLDE